MKNISRLSYKILNTIWNSHVEQSSPETASSGDFAEAVFRPEFFLIFPAIFGRFLPGSTESWQKSTGKNPDNSGSEYCFHVPAISGVFLQDPAGSGGQNHRPGLWQILHWILVTRKYDVIFADNEDKDWLFMIMTFLLVRICGCLDKLVLKQIRLRATSIVNKIKQ
jgi:hypothetical protein